MIHETNEPRDQHRELSQLRQFNGTPAEFWPKLASSLNAVAKAARTVIVVRENSPEAAWKKLADYSPDAGQKAPAQHFTRKLQELAEQGTQATSAVIKLDAPDPDSTDHAALVRFDLGTDRQVCIGILHLRQTPATDAHEIARRIALVIDLPRSYLQARSATEKQQEGARYATAMDAVLLLDQETRFLSAAITLCNELAAKFECDRVSLGWIEKGYVRLKAMSRTEDFNRRMSAASALEAAMEEACDQDEDIALPATEDARLVTRDHERYAADQQSGAIASFPLRQQGKSLAALTCERRQRPFDRTELQQIRLIADLSARRIADLWQADLWFGARASSALRAKASSIIGPDHTWTKILAAGLAAVLAVLLFVKVPFRVEANFQLRSDEVAYLTAPYDSFLREVHVRPGDVVSAGQLLLQMDTEDLLLEEASAVADLVRYQREAEKAEAESKLAEMRVADSLAEQSEARLSLIRYRLAHAQLSAPYDSVVIEGDLREQVGIPLKQGDALVRLARLDDLYVEAKVDERDIHEITGVQTGEIAFVSQPNLKFPVRLERIEPAALADEAENVFLVRCAIEGTAGDWWRPGMTGVCKLNAGKRTIAWIFTRRTIDFLRMFFWW